MTTGASNGGSSVSSSVSPVERRQALLNERLLHSLDELMQQLRSEHESDWRQQFSDALSTTETAINDETQRLRSALSEALGQIERQQTRRISGWEQVLSESEARQRQQVEGIEQKLAAAATQAERLSRVGGIRSWARSMAITVAIMLAVAGVTASGLHLTDWLIESRKERLDSVNEKLKQAQRLLPEGVEILEINDQTYLVGLRVSPDIQERGAGWIGIWGDHPVVQLTE
ncbi:hypothetical protein [Halomonas sp. Y3]|uniref:hypothetical protein n=1 Tax=Halomonas sp. Y3 TaxID=2956797 RepID=UPI0020A18DBE|nr:hypothetical protein [Halomonas sp. Y3]